MSDLSQQFLLALLLILVKRCAQAAQQLAMDLKQALVNESNGPESLRPVLNDILVDFGYHGRSHAAHANSVGPSSAFHSKVEGVDWPEYEEDRNNPQQRYIDVDLRKRILQQLEARNLFETIVLL